MRDAADRGQGVDEGQVIGGRYTVLGPLGAGGMAEVFRAHDDALGRDVALKVLHPGLAADADFAERFRREARAAAGLSHPHIVTVYDWGEDGKARYIVMEYVPGENLRDRVRREGHLSESDALDIAAQVADALATAHAVGLVHRDVKPANILVRPDGRVQVTDFGIARATGDSPLTATNLVMGTAHYVSPEQVQHRPLDGRADLYALGCVLYEMLAGVAPFAGESLVAVAYQHVNEAAPRVRDLHPEISERTAAVLTRALAKAPADRYPNAAAMRDALLAARRPLLAAAERTETLPQTPPQTPPQTLSNSPASVAATTTTVLPETHITATGVLPVSRPDARLSDPIVVEPFPPPGTATTTRRRGGLAAWFVLPFLLVLLLGGFAGARFLSGRSPSVTAAPGTTIAAAPPTVPPGAPPTSTRVRISEPMMSATMPAAVPVIVQLAPTASATRVAQPTATPLPTPTPFPTAVLAPTATLPPEGFPPPAVGLPPMMVMGAPTPVPTPAPAPPIFAPGAATPAFVPATPTPLAAQPPTPTPLAVMPTPAPPPMPTAPMEVVVVLPTATPVPPTAVPPTAVLTRPAPTPVPTPVPPTSITVRLTVTPPRPTATANDDDDDRKPGANTPTEAVASFYRLVSERRYDEAATLWSPRQQMRFPPQSNINGRFGDTQNIAVQNARITSQMGNRATVAVTLVERKSNGAVQQFVGSWNLVRDRGGWLLDEPAF